MFDGYQQLMDWSLLCAALPCFYVYTQSEESTPYGSATTDTEALNELEEADLVDEIEDPYGIVEGVGELWEGEEYEPEQALNADRTYLKFKKKLDLSPEQCFRCCLAELVYLRLFWTIVQLSLFLFQLKS